MLTQFEARGFRNLEALELTFGGGRHLILGANGAGKTSLLEAVYLLATTRSFRTPRIGECARHGSHSFFLAGETSSRIQLQVQLADGERQRWLNGGRSSLAEHLAVMPVLSWTAADSEQLTGPPSLRRRLLDRGVVGLRPAAISVLSRYRQALKEKRRLLQGRCSRDELAPWNQVLAAAAAELAMMRSDYAERMSRSLTEVLELCALQLPSIDLRYRPSPKVSLEGTEAVYQALEDYAEREIQQQQPLIGPHRDDLAVRWGGHPVRRVASAGERKALGLALLAAGGRVLEKESILPIYLLDDADTELDQERLSALWQFFARANQVLVTSNRPLVWRSLDFDNRWRCDSGNIAPE